MSKARFKSRNSWVVVQTLNSVHLLWNKLYCSQLDLPYLTHWLSVWLYYIILYYTHLIYIYMNQYKPFARRIADSQHTILWMFAHNIIFSWTYSQESVNRMVTVMISSMPKHWNSYNSKNMSWKKVLEIYITEKPMTSCLTCCLMKMFLKHFLKQRPALS